MLTGLTIKNVVLIDKLHIDFENGFCALTGETGAGKSILLDSLSLALGARSESSLVRKGEKQAQVSASFDIPKEHPAHTIISENGLDGDDTLILRRIIKADGGSRAFVNDQPVSVSLLKKMGDVLVEIHGQFDTHGLLDQKNHALMLDEYADINRGAIKESWDLWRKAKQELEQAKAKIDTLRSEEEYLRQAVQDLDSLDPENGEEDKLSSLREKLMRRDQMMESYNSAYESLSEAEGLIGTAWKSLEKVGDDSNSIIEGVSRASAEIQEVINEVRSQSTDLQESEYSLEEIDDRLHDLRAQARKHNCSVNELGLVRDKLASELNMIEAQDGALADLMSRVDEMRALYIEKAELARENRLKAADKLDGYVKKELGPLKLEKADFSTQVNKLDEESWGPYGMDNISFLVSTNPGSAPGPLNKIASGGEMSRFMLAIKVVMASVGVSHSLVFDEVDSGIGGATASAVGERLARLSRTKQILVVTHSPQVAARASYHWIVLKGGKDELKTKIIPLSELDERREEIARMLSGSSVTSEARAAADKLMEAKG